MYMKNTTNKFYKSSSDTEGDAKIKRTKRVCQIK